MVSRRSAISRRGWGFHNVRGGAEPGNHSLRPRRLEVIDVWKDFWSGDGLYSPRVSFKRLEAGVLVGALGVAGTARAVLMAAAPVWKVLAAMFAGRSSTPCSSTESAPARSKPWCSHVHRVLRNNSFCVCFLNAVELDPGQSIRRTPRPVALGTSR